MGYDVRTLRKSSRRLPSSQLPHKNFHPLLHHHYHHTHHHKQHGCSLFFLFSSGAVHISLLHNCNHNLSSNCVQSASNVLQLGPSLVYFLFLLYQLYSITKTTAVFLTISLKNYFTASLSCCCCYMSFQHTCKLYTCWLRLILYLIKQMIDPSINQAIEIVILTSLA